MKEKIVTFEAQNRKEYVNTVFTGVFVAGLLITVSYALTYFIYIKTFGLLADTGFEFYLKTFGGVLLASLSTAIPMFIYGLCVDNPPQKIFKQKPITSVFTCVRLGASFFVLTVTAAIVLLGLSLLLIDYMKSVGYEFIYSYLIDLSNTGETVGQKIFYVVVRSVIPAVMCEAFFRAPVMNRVIKDNYFLAVFVPALTFSTYHTTFEEFAVSFAMGLGFGWLYLLTRSLKATTAVHCLVNVVIYTLYTVFGQDLADILLLPYIFLPCLVVFVIELMGIITGGYTPKHGEEDKPFNIKEILRAMFLNFGLYATVFVILFQFGTWRLRNPNIKVPEPGHKDEAAKTEEADLDGLLRENIRL